MKNMKTNKISLAVIALVSATIAFSSCEREDGIKVRDGKYVTLKVASTSGVLTKASSEILETVELTDNGQTLFLSGSVAPNNYTFDAPLTKADAPITALTQFKVRMTQPDGNAFEEGIAKHDGHADGTTYWSIYNDSEKIAWSEDSNIDNPSQFLAVYPSATIYGSNGIVYNAGNAKSDILVAYETRGHEHDNYHNESSYVVLDFYHPLSLVRFAVAESINITDIVVNNAATSAVISTTKGEGDFNYLINNKGELKATADPTVKDGYKVYSFYVVPGSLGENAMNVTFYVDGKILTTKNLGTTEWKSGMIYNYTLNDGYSFNTVVNIEMENNLIVNKTPNAVWVRAAFVATQYNAKGFVTSSRMVTATAPAGWTLKNGFYYKDTPVVGYEKVELPISISTGETLHASVQAIPYELGTSAVNAYSTL